jgi:putative ATP-binding cassette transporter
MSLIELIRAHAGAALPGFFALAALAAFSNALVLAILNSAADPAAAGGGDGRSFAMFIIVIAIYAISQRRIMIVAAQEVERLLERLRLEAVRRALCADFLALERLGRPALHAALAHEIQAISSASTVLVIACQSALLIAFTIIYIATISVIAAAVVAAVVGAAYALYRVRAPRQRADLDAATAEERRLFAGLRDLLDGFKEVKLNAARSDALVADLAVRSHRAAERRTEAQAGASRQFLLTQTGLYVLLGLFVVAVPAAGEAYTEEMVRLTTAALFMTGSLGSLVQTAPILAGANAAAENVAALTAALGGVAADEAGTDGAPTASATFPPDFDSIRAMALRFRYDTRPRAESFAVGPVDLSIPRGELLFVTGGNGSGKSTLLRLLTALYPPQGGVLAIDDRPVEPDRRQAYRDLIAAVFSDFHLFRRLYGVPDSDPDEVRHRLEQFGLADKVTYVDGAFTSLDLSAGQRRRLALVVALLEKRPILALDELAADLDPAFRRRLYRELLPAWSRKEGRTIIATTHDDRFFHVADRCLRMRDGRFVDQAAEAAT